MARFEIAEKLTGRNEYGYNNDPDDRGKRTLNGISQVKHPNWKGWPRVMAIIQKVGENKDKINAAVKADPVLQGLISEFYKREFWDINSLDAVQSQLVANEVYDSSVNLGPVTAAKYLQQALNLCNRNQELYPDVDEDGKISAAGETIRTLNQKANPTIIYRTLNMLQGERYLNIMRASKSQEKYWPGWLERATSTL